MPKTITGIIEFELAKVDTSNGLEQTITSSKKMQKKFKKLLKLTIKYMQKLAKLHYDTAKIRYNDTEFVAEKIQKEKTK